MTSFLTGIPIPDDSDTLKVLNVGGGEGGGGVK